MKKTKNKKKAFTLAEILITLSIIGVVAALTIPTLIQRTGDEEMVSKLMKVYSTLSQATEAIITEQGSPNVWNTDADSLYNAYKAKLRNAKECGSGEGCFKQGRVKYLNGNWSGNWNSERVYRKLILSDGVQLQFWHMSSDCINNWASSCAQIVADLNGEKAPNIIGRDIFLFFLKTNGLYPRGCDAENIEDECSIDNGGEGCACRVLQEGKINY